MMRPDRRDQDAARLEPRLQLLRDLLHRGGHDDPVEGAGVVGDIKAVAKDHLDVVATELLQPGARALGKGAVALDADDLPAEPRQDRSLVARAGADFEHPMRLLHVQLLGHIGNHEGLADGLAAGDSERAVPVGISTVGGLYERLTRDFFHGAQYRLVADPAPPQAELKHHLFRRIWRYGHITLEAALSKRRG